MTDFRKAYKKIHDSVVGLGYITPDGGIEICGTGFVLHSGSKQAIVLTNQHVIEGLNGIQPSDGRTCAILFHDRMIKDEHGTDVPFTEIVRCPIPFWGLLAHSDDGPVPAVPGFEDVVNKPYARADIGLAIIDTRGKSLQPASIELIRAPEEGLPVALLGYPRGVTISATTASAHLQCTPILQAGVLSAVLPHRSAPHTTFVVDIYTDRGSSGSPLFDATGTVLGIVFAGRLQSDGHSMSSQLMAVPLTELPPPFQGALQTGEVSDLYEFLKNATKSKAANGA